MTNFAQIAPSLPAIDSRPPAPNVKLLRNIL